MDKVRDCFQAMLLSVIIESRAIDADAPSRANARGLNHCQSGALERVMADCGEVERCEHAGLSSERNAGVVTHWRDTDPVTQREASNFQWTEDCWSTFAILRYCSRACRM